MSRTPKFIIEREIPGAGKMTAAELRGISEHSNSVLRTMPGVTWQQSFVAGDKIYCVYVAPDADAVREHARRGGFPANSVVPVSAVIDPSTGDAR